MWTPITSSQVPSETGRTPGSPAHHRARCCLWPACHTAQEKKAQQKASRHRARAASISSHPTSQALLFPKSSAFNNFCYPHMLQEGQSDRVQVDQCTRDPWDPFSTFSNIFSAPVHLPISSQLLPPLLTSLPGAGNQRSTRCSGCRSIDSQSPAATKPKPVTLCCGLSPKDAQRLAFGQPALYHAAVGFLPSSEALQASNQYINPPFKATPPLFPCEVLCNTWTEDPKHHNLQDWKD